MADDPTPDQAAPVVPLRPMLPVATALADALDALGWDGKVDSICFPIVTEAGIKLGDLEIHVRPHSYVSVGGRVAPVDAPAFLKAMRTSLSKPFRPKADQPAPASPAAVLDAAGPSRAEQRHRYRTPFPWEQDGD